MRAPVITFLSCAVLCCATSTAHAANLTGSYVGKWSCKTFDGTKFKLGNKAATMEITQTGTAIAVHIDSPMAPFGEFFYNGTVIDDTAKPEKGEAVLLQCGTSDVLLPDVESEMARATVKTKADGKGTFKALSIFAADDPIVGTCKYGFKRINTTDPAIAACP